MDGHVLSGVAPFSMIVTNAGERAADSIEAGESVITLARAGFGTVARILDVTVDLRQRPDAAAVLVAKDALHDGSPLRPLVVGPEALIGLDDWLVPAAALVNGRSITRMPADGSVRYVQYVQVELGEHEMVICDGVRVGTVLRGGDTCRPLLRGGPVLEALRGRIRGRISGLEEAGLIHRSAGG